MNKAFFVLPVILLALLTAIYTGWLRLGWSMPVSNAVGQHGAIMVGSFLASLILLERAVTFQQKSVLLLPFINGVSILFFLFHQPVMAQYCLVAGALGFIIMCGYFIYRYKELYYYVFFAAAFCLFAGNLILVKTQFYPNSVNWWMAFLLLTIVAERLELSRFLSLTAFKRNQLLAALAIVIIALFIPFHFYGNILFAIGLIFTAAWLLLYDMARHAVKTGGQHRYSAVLLLTGYAWLIIAAIVFSTGNQFIFSYDAALHSFFIGFVFSMIFSHAPIILPAIARLPLKLYRPVLYWWFALLQLSLLARVIGDLTENILLRKWGGLLNGISILVFFITVGIIVKKELAKRRGLRKA